MNKKVLIAIIAILAVCAVGIGGFLIARRGTSNTAENESVKEEVKELRDNGAKVLVAYYSAQSHTKTVAETMAEESGADIFEIVPEDVYTSADLDWTDSDSRVTREHEDTSLRDIALSSTEVENWDDYDIVLLGYPIWWGIAAWPIDNFVKANNFEGKTVIPFCTSASSGIGQSGELLAAMANGGNWQSGKRFSQNASSSEVTEWVKDMNLSK